jgi:peptidoglycan/LPS O-acetylase OafA/YrhL
MKNGRAGKVTMLSAVAAFLVFTISSYVLTIDPTELTGKWARAGYYFIAFERSLFPRWLLFFMLGRWMGIHWTDVKNSSMKYRRLLSLSVVASLILCALDFYYLRLWSGNMHLLPPDWMISCFLFGSLFAIWFLTLPVQANFLFEWLGKLGGISFGVYLLHEPLLSMIMRSTYWHFFSGVLPNAFLRQSIAITMGLGFSLVILSVLQIVLPTRVKRYVLG